MGDKKRALGFSLGVLRFEASEVLERRQCCPYCKAPLTISTMSLDHKIPVCRAVELRATLEEQSGHALPEVVKDERIKSLAFNFYNYDFVCKPCNKRKGDLTHYEFKQLLALVTTMHSTATSYILRKLGARLPFFKKSKAEGAAA